MEQTLDYIRNEVNDVYLDLSLKKADSLTDEEKLFILERFFRVNWEKVVNKKPRYADLLMKRGYQFNRYEDSKVLTSFSEQDFMDLQTLFELSWISECAIEEDKELKRIEEKGKNYTEDEKLFVLKKEKELIKKILPIPSFSRHEDLDEQIKCGKEIVEGYFEKKFLVYGLQREGSLPKFCLF